MSRLPTPGSDNGNWGQILNEFLSKSHQSDGSVKPGAVTTAAIAPAAVSEDKLDPAVQSKLNATAATSPQAATAPSSLPGRFAWYGDSIVLYGEGWPYYAQALSTNAAIRPVLCASNPGMDSAWLLAHVDAQIINASPKPPVCVFMAGANDAQSAVTLSSYRSNMVAVVSKLQTAGITPILCTVTPNNTAAYDANVRLYNAWLRIWCPNNGVLLVDTHAVVAKSAGGWITGMDGGDGLHPGSAGQRAMAQTLVSAMGPIVAPSGSPLAYTSGSPNLVANSALLTDANSDGVPDGWLSSGLAPTYIVDTTNGFKWARITGSGTTLGKLNSPEITSGYTAGTDKLRFAARIRSGQNGATGKAGLKIEVTCYDNAYGVKGNFMATSLNGGLSQQIADGVCVMDFTVPTGTTKIIVTLSNGTFDGAAGVTGTYDMALPTLQNLTTLGIT